MTGDLSKWAIIEKLDLLGLSGDKYYTDSHIPIVLSSENCERHTGKLL